MDTIYFSHDSHELALADFEHLDQRDLICIIRNVIISDLMSDIPSLMGSGVNL